jgi:hypothetical protein
LKTGEPQTTSDKHLKAGSKIGKKKLQPLGDRSVESHLTLYLQQNAYPRVVSG